MVLDNYVEADILSTCNSLGSEIRGIYEKGNDCVDCLKDILRYLKRDNEEHSVLRFLGSIRLLQTDLLPIIKRYDKDKDIFDFTLRILVALTNPALLLYKEDIPEDKISRNVYLQLISYLQNYKKAFIDVNVWKIFYEHLKDLLKIRPIERSSNENLFIERIIILMRNVLHIPADESILKITDDDVSPHDKILQCLQESKINILILYMAANEEEHQYCLHVLEIVFLIHREHTSETIASSNEIRSNSEKEKDLKALLAARNREKNLKSQKIQSVYASRFNGVYCVKNMKSLSDKDYIAHKLITNTNDVKFDLEKNAKRRPKNRMRAKDIDNTRQSTLSIRLFLKKFCIEFLKTYNKLMVSVKRELLRKVSDEHDDTYYLWAICYFMEFNRLYDFQPALVSETISIQSFHHIQTQITNYHEMMLSDKKKSMFWAKRMQLGINAYKELLETLRKMERSKDEIIKDSADALISHVFYVIEYREMLLSLLSSYDEVKFPLSYLAKLVESAQLFLKMLENHSKKHSEIIVQKKQRKIRKKKKKKSTVFNESVNMQDKLNEQWDAVSSELSAAVQGRRKIPNVTPFDGASEMSFEEQKIEAVYKIRESLILNEPCKALGLLRAARELWPEGDSFGSADIEPEPEFLILREIHFSNLQRNPPDTGTEDGVEFEVEDSDEDDEEMEAMALVAEQKLDMNEIYKKYASHKVVKPCSLLLANYRNNKPYTNTCLIKLLHRIAWNCKMHALFFQSTIFLTFQKIFHDPDITYDPIIKEFYRFAKFIVQKFFDVAEKNKKNFVELLFWKGTREAYELEEGYGASESRVKGWNEDEEEELKYLFEENKDIYVEGQDVADIILANFNSRNRTKPQIVSALKRLGLIKSIKDLKPEKRKEWLEAEIIELQNLFDDFKSSDDVMGIILDKLSIKRSRKAVIEKLLELNLIQDKKELRKKSSKRHKKFATDSDNNSSEESDDILDNNYNEETYNYGSLNAESSDEAEINFFRNLEAERFADDDETKESNSHSRKKANIHSPKRKAKSKKLPELWEEQEIMELTALFQENQESDNIMDIILNSLSVKRPKQGIIEKLLELGLIKDKKEIRKRKSVSNRSDSMLNSKIKSNKSSRTSENYDSDLQSDINDVPNTKLKRKRLKQQILSSSDEDIPLSHASTSKDFKGNKNGGMVKKIQAKVWEEQGIVELNQLFLEYKDSDDMISNIVKNLTFKETKKNVTEKLFEIGLIKDKTELKKKNASLHRKLPTKLNAKNVSEKMKIKSSDLWDEQEILDLNQLYQSNKGSDDIMSSILQGLQIKRHKQKVIEKMLEIGLIQDRKEVRKKRTIKCKQTKQNLNETADTENELKDNSMNHRNRNSKKVFSDSSDDEILPLSHIIGAGDLITNSSSNIYTPESSLKVNLQENVSIKSKHVSNESLEISDNRETSINSDLSSRNNKRKRVLISKDDDSSDDDANRAEELIKAHSENIKSSVLHPSEYNFPDHSIPKVQKKKIRILDDSDESS